MSSPGWCCSGSSHSNLRSFLQRVTPVVASGTLSGSCLNYINSLWQSPGKDTIEYFTLKDLWDSYEEWSAYGASTPVMLECDETVMQYYVPSLSGMQIFCDKSVAASRNRREDSDGIEFESDYSWSEDSRSDDFSRSLSNNSSKAWDAVSEDSSSEHDGSWLTRDKIGYLYLHYNETSSPYRRVPLVEKITELARSHPAIMTLKSVDLSPASWMSVAWYPIYSIPSRNHEKNLAACFLTYHTLSSSFLDNGIECGEIDMGKNASGTEKCETKKSDDSISLSPFGLATYKMNGEVWLNKEAADHERMADLCGAADSWLKQLNVHHHDFNYFRYQSYL